MAATHPKPLYRYPFVNPGVPVVHECKLGKSSLGNLLKGFRIAITGQLALSGQSVVGVANGEPSAAGLVTRIIVETKSNRGLATPDGKIVEIVPRTALFRRMLEKVSSGFKQPDIRLGAAGIVPANGNIVVNAVIDIPFALPRLVNPIESALKMDDYDLIRLTLTSQSLAALFVGNNAVVDYSGLRYEIQEIREVNPSYQPIRVPYINDQFVYIGGANPRMIWDAFITQTGLFLDFLALTETTSSALADTIINRLFISSGSDAIEDPYFDQIKGDQQDFVSDLANSMVGVHYRPLAAGLEDARGLLTSAVPDLSIKADVANPGGANVDRVILSTRRVAVRQVPANAA
jgi:hypothetical protein